MEREGGGGRVEGEGGSEGGWRGKVGVREGKGFSCVLIFVYMMH